MTSAIEAQAFQFNEMRPETSKCSRATQNKFNKTLTGFHNNNDNQNQIIQGYQSGVGQNDNLSAQKGMMNITGFNFRQNKHQEQKNNAAENQNQIQQKTPKQSILLQQNQQFSSTSQGFYQNKRQNSFSKGITLEQYFQNVQQSDSQIKEDENQKAGLLVNNKNNEANTPSRSKFPQAFQLSDIKLLDDDSSNPNQKQTWGNIAEKQENETVKKRSSTSNFEMTNQEYSKNMLEEQYDTDEFEIHEESGEEEEEDDEENKKRKKKKLVNQINNSSSKSKTRQVSYIKNGESNGSPQISRERKSNGINKYRSNDNYDSKDNNQFDLEEEEELQKYETDNKIQSLSKKQSNSIKVGDDPIKQQKENDVNSSNKSSHKLGSVEHIKVPISNEDQIQKKIRDKYFKKTLHKPFNTQQVAQSNQGNKKVCSNSNNNTTNSNNNSNNNNNNNNSYTNGSQSTIGSNNVSVSSSSNNSLLFNNTNSNQSAAAVANLKQSNQQNQSQTNPMTSSNYLSQNNQNYQQPNVNMSQIHTKITAPYQASYTGHNFYSQNATNGFNGANNYNNNNQNINNNHNNNNNINNQNSPNAYLYAAANTANRKANRSQSPLHTFKRQSNLGHSQQRRLSKEMAEPNIPDDNQIMRTTFNNTTKKFKLQQNNGNQALNNYDASSGINNGGSFENHIAFRNSFYNKGPPLNTLPNSNYAGISNGGNNGIPNNPMNGNQINNNSKQRLTINDFYKNPSKYDCYDQPIRGNNGGFNQQNNNNGDYLPDVMMMRRTAKENKFLNQKDKIQEMAKEDANYITKHAARFNINPSELQIKQKN